MAAAAEAREHAPDRIFEGPHPPRIEDQLRLNAGRQGSAEAAVWEGDGKPEGERQLVADPWEAPLHELDDVVHRALRLRKRVLIEGAALSADFPDPLAPIEDE